MEGRSICKNEYYFFLNLFSKMFLSREQIKDLPTNEILTTKIKFLYRMFELSEEFLNNVGSQTHVSPDSNSEKFPEDILHRPFVFKENSLKDIDFFFLHYDDDTKTKIKTFLSLITKKDITKVECFDPKKTVILHNLVGINRDRRGTIKLDKKFRFHKEWRLRDNTLLSLLEGLFQIKSHKFDNWYELFVDCADYLEEFESGKEYLHIFLDFDHGS